MHGVMTMIAFYSTPSLDHYQLELQALNKLLPIPVLKNYIWKLVEKQVFQYFAGISAYLVPLLVWLIVLLSPIATYHLAQQLSKHSQHCSICSIFPSSSKLKYFIHYA